MSIPGPVRDHLPVLVERQLLEMALLTGKGENIGVRRQHRGIGADEHPWDGGGQSCSLGSDKRPEELGEGRDVSHLATRAIRWTSHTSYGGDGDISVRCSKSVIL